MTRTGPPSQGWRHTAATSERYLSQATKELKATRAGEALDQALCKDVTKMHLKGLVFPLIIPYGNGFGGMMRIKTVTKCQEVIRNLGRLGKRSPLYRVFCTRKDAAGSKINALVRDPVFPVVCLLSLSRRRSRGGRFLWGSDCGTAGGAGASAQARRPHGSATDGQTDTPVAAGADVQLGTPKLTALGSCNTS